VNAGLNKEGAMMFQPIDYPQSQNDHPHRQTVIEKDEILGLRIDLEILTPSEFYRKYFRLGRQET
jgi:hypothetical protein